MSARKLSQGTSRSIASSGSPFADSIATRLSASKNPNCPIANLRESSAHAADSHRLPQRAIFRGALKAFDGPNTPTDPGLIDGNFGQRTESAVRAYQTRQSISVDGIVGDLTWWAPAGAAGATLAKLAGLV